MTKKVSLIICSVVLGISILGITPASTPSDPTSFQEPEKGKWCLGYDYKKGAYRYNTATPIRETQIQQTATSSRSSRKVRLIDHKNFTKEQARDIEEYLDSQYQPSQQSEYDIEDIIDNSEYYQ